MNEYRLSDQKKTLTFFIVSQNDLLDQCKDDRYIDRQIFDYLVQRRRFQYQIRRLGGADEGKRYESREPEYQIRHQSRVSRHFPRFWIHA